MDQNVSTCGIDSKLIGDESDKSELISSGSTVHFVSGNGGNDTIRSRIGSRNKCKSAALLLGLVKTRARQAEKKNRNSYSEDCVNDLSKPHLKNTTRIKVSHTSLKNSSSSCQSVITPLADSKMNINCTKNTAWLKPFDCGWRREVVHRCTSKSASKPNADVYYFTPDKVKLRSMPEVIDYLKRLNSGLTGDCFTFIREPIFHEPSEVVRLAGISRGRHSTSTSTSQGSSCTKSPFCINTALTKQSDITLNDDKPQSSGVCFMPLSGVNHGTRKRKIKTASLLPGNSKITCKTLLKSSAINLVSDCDSRSQLTVEVKSDSSVIVKNNNVQLASVNSDTQSLKQNNEITAVKFETPLLPKHAVNKDRKEPETSICIDAKLSKLKVASSINYTANIATNNVSSQSAILSTVTNASNSQLKTKVLKSTFPEMESHLGLSSSVSSRSNRLHFQSVKFRLKSATRLPLTHSKSLSSHMSMGSVLQIKSTSDRSAFSKLNGKGCISAVSVAKLDINKSDSLMNTKMNISSASNDLHNCMEERLCGLECAGRFGVPPSLHCDMCMSAFHPECVGFSYIGHKTGFVCKSCQQLQRELFATKYSVVSQSAVDLCENSVFNVPKSCEAFANIKQQEPNVNFKLVSEEVKTKDADYISFISSVDKTCTVPSKTNESSHKFSVVTNCAVNEVQIAVTKPCIGSASESFSEHQTYKSLAVPSPAKFCLTDALNKDGTSQVLFLPIAIQHLLNLSLPVELLIENKKILLTCSSYRMTACEFMLVLPPTTLMSNYLIGSRKPFVCEVFPASKSCNQILKVNY